MFMPKKIIQKILAFLIYLFLFLYRSFIYLFTFVKYKIIHSKLNQIYCIMSKITDKRVMRITVIYPNKDVETIIQLQSYQSTGSWVRYFLDDGAEKVEISFN